MKATGVIVRFLSLLDVALILLGVLMIALMHAQLRSSTKHGSPSPDGMAEIAGVDFVYLYAGWKGPENGRCYLITANRKIGREVNMVTGDDIREIFASRRAHTEASNQLVMLVFSDDGWYSAWDAKTLAAIEQVWKTKVVPVYNVRLPR